ncbi:MAG TPA: hypothetical protein VF503_17225 [Sphingobium sp.]|uniref:hypothetical protein n=1 Tax=Sphingobium sp. TaxID=1912891 RepID=UPI002ED67340
MRLPIENDLQVKLSEALAEIHAQCRFALAVALDKPARLVPLHGEPALAFKLATGQSRVSAFNAFDLYAQYEWKQNSLPPITLELGITNVLNTNPPIFEGSSAGIGTGTANGQTLVRVLQLGMNVKL